MFLGFFIFLFFYPDEIMNLYASTGSDSNHEGRKNNNEANPSLRRDVRKATDKLGTGADASYKVGTVKGVVQIKADALDKLRSRMRARLSHQSLADFMAACSPPETAFDPISFYFACHKTKVPPSPTVVSNNDGNTFFYWKPIEDKIKSKDDKLRLVPSLWSAEDSEKIVALWEQLEPEEKKKDYSRQASKFFGVEGEVDAKFDRAFLAAVSVYLIRSNDTWKTWFNKNHPRGEPDFVNIVLGHLKRSSEWQAYWKYIIS